MKRKISATTRTRIVDQLIGFIAFPVVNLPLWLAVNWLSARARSSPHGSPASDTVVAAVLLMPWIINGVALVWAFFFHPYLAIGYLAFIASIVFMIVGLGILWVPACLVALSVWVFWLAVVQPGEPRPMVAVYAFFGAIVVGLIALELVFISALVWWPLALEEWKP